MACTFFLTNDLVAAIVLMLLFWGGGRCVFHVWGWRSDHCVPLSECGWCLWFPGLKVQKQYGLELLGDVLSDHTYPV